MDKKYEITEETKEYNGIILYRIKALKDFGNVKAGELGGFIEKESNLSQSGNCWIYNDAKALNNAMIYENAQIYNETIIRDYAKAFGNVQLFERVNMRHNSIAHGDAKISGDITLADNTIVEGNANLSGSMVLEGHVVLGGDTILNGEYYIQNPEDIIAHATPNYSNYLNPSLFNRSETYNHYILK